MDEYDTLSASASSTGVSALGPAGATRRKPWLATAAVLIGIVGVVVGWWGLRRGAVPPSAQPFQSMRLTTQTTSGDVADCVVSPDGRYLAYLAGRAGRLSLRVRQLATGSDLEVLPLTDAGLQDPAFSPDGNYLFFLERKADARNYNALFQVPSLGGTAQERAFDVDSRVTFSPDGKQLAFWRGVPQKQESQLLVFDLESAKERVVASVANPEEHMGSPTWSPDGQRIATTILTPAPDLQSSIALFDPTSGRRQDLLGLPWTILRSIAWLPDGRGLVAAGIDLKTSITNQVFLVDYPAAKVQRITNDFNQYLGVSVSARDEAIAAVRQTGLANLWIAAAGGSPARQVTRIATPENSPGSLAVAGTSIVYGAARDDAYQIWAIGADGGEPRTLTTGRVSRSTPMAPPARSCSTGWTRPVCTSGACGRMAASCAS